ncbi:MAG TPA: peptidoglycan-binding domain-containing protein [Flavilitoribacter sp.]|nr:peptidoglycan-binding domain-containing protein [Flavilitoribacter sp.]
MKRSYLKIQLCFHFLVISGFWGFFTKPGISGVLKASKTNPEGIFVRVDSISLDKTDLKRLKFKFYRREEGNGKSYESLQNEFNPSWNFFDNTATPGIWYEYEVEVIRMEQREILLTKEVVKGYRPPKKKMASETPVVSDPFRVGDHIVVRWSFPGSGLANKLGKTAYKIQYTDDPLLEYSTSEGFGLKKKQVFREEFKEDAELIIPFKPGMKLIRLCIKMFSPNGETKFFYKLIRIDKKSLKTLDRAQLEPVRNEENSLQWASSDPNPPNFEPGKCYSISFLPGNSSALTADNQEENEALLAYIRSLESIYFSFNGERDSGSNLSNGLSMSANSAGQTVNPDSAKRNHSVERSNRLERPGKASFQNGSEREKHLAFKDLAGLKIGIMENPPDSLSALLPRVLSRNNYATLKRINNIQGIYLWTEVLCDKEVNPQLIMNLQIILNYLGYPTGGDYGIFDAWTRSAITGYQLKVGLPLGNLDLPTLRRLGLISSHQ